MTGLKTLATAAITALGLMAPQMGHGSTITNGLLDPDLTLTVFAFGSTNTDTQDTTVDRDWTDGDGSGLDPYLFPGDAFLIDASGEILTVQTGGFATTLTLTVSGWAPTLELQAVTFDFADITNPSAVRVDPASILLTPTSWQATMNLNGNDSESFAFSFNEVPLPAGLVLLLSGLGGLVLLRRRHA